MRMGGGLRLGRHALIWQALYTVLMAGNVHQGNALDAKQGSVRAVHQDAQHGRALTGTFRTRLRSSRSQVATM